MSALYEHLRQLRRGHGITLSKLDDNKALLFLLNVDNPKDAMTIIDEQTSALQPAALGEAVRFALGFDSHEPTLTKRREDLSARNGYQPETLEVYENDGFRELALTIGAKRRERDRSWWPKESESLKRGSFHCSCASEVAAYHLAPYYHKKQRVEVVLNAQNVIVSLLVECEIAFIETARYGLPLIPNFWHMSLLPKNTLYERKRLKFVPSRPVQHFEFEVRAVEPLALCGVREEDRIDAPITVPRVSPDGTGTLLIDLQYTEPLQVEPTLFWVWV